MPKISKGQIYLKDMYTWYVALYKKHVDYETYKKVVKMWGKGAQELLLEGKDVPLYADFKLLGVRKRYRPYYVDRNLSKIERRTVLVPNTHSDFYGAAIYWKKKGSRFKIKSWVFKPIRELSRSLASVMKQPGGHKKFTERVRISGHSNSYEKRAKRYKI